MDEEDLPEAELQATYVASAGPTVIKQGWGVCYGLFVTGLGTGGTIDLYDGLDATGEHKASLDSPFWQRPYEIDFEFMTGLTVVLSVPAKVTVIWS